MCLRSSRKVHPVQMMNPCPYFLKYFQLGRISIKHWYIKFFLPLRLFSPHRLTSHLWISHGLADNSWSPYHGPAAFNMNHKTANQAYQWMTDWLCMARGQREVGAQWPPPSALSSPRLEIPAWHEGGPSVSTMYGTAWHKCCAETWR